MDCVFSWSRVGSISVRMNSELKRRNVFRMAALYVISAWLAKRSDSVTTGDNRGVRASLVHQECRLSYAL